MQEQLTINQHIISIFFQLLWDCGQKHVWEFNKKYAYIKWRAIVNNCSDEYTYEDDKDLPNNRMERWFEQKIETPYSKPYKNLISARNCIIKLSREQKEMVCKICANILTRHPKFIYDNRNKLEWDTKVAKYDSNLTATTRSRMNDLCICNCVDFVAILLACDVKVLVSKEPRVVFCDTMTEQTLMIGSKLYFPLSPNVLIVFDNEETSDEWTISFLPDEEYECFINLLISNDRVQNIYSSNKETAERIKTIYIECDDKIDTTTDRLVGLLKSSNRNVKEKAKAYLAPMINEITTELKKRLTI